MSTLPRVAPKDDERWNAVVGRDRRFDGRFVFAVRTTGIYCRPSCPARRPARPNVAFYEAGAEAEKAGFRPCRRCRPQAPAAADPRAELVAAVCRHIDEGLDEPLTLRTLGERVGLSPFHLQRTFKKVMGVTPRQYADSRRMGVFKAKVKGGQHVTDATYEAGFGSSSRLYERASGQLGMTPATYRRGGRGMTIAYTVVACPLGRLLVGATARGLSSVCLGDSDAALEAALREEYPEATLRREDVGLGRWVRTILAAIDGRPVSDELPLDILATAFQRRVWEALRRIPRGETRTYGEVARAVGRPRAVRAVARACATNPVAVVVPCHRVVGAGGTLTGYRWGVPRKKRLLAREQAGTRKGR